MRSDREERCQIRAVGVENLQVLSLFSAVVLRGDDDIKDRLKNDL